MICGYTSAILDVERHLTQRIWTAIRATQGIKMAGVLHWAQGGRWKVINCPRNAKTAAPKRLIR